MITAARREAASGEAGGAGVPAGTAMSGERRAMSNALILGHRGAPGARENTLEAFAEARRQGADGVELDVRATPEGVLVVHHDPLPDPLPPWVPTLEDALDACEGMVVNVEIKNLPGDPDFDPSERIAVAVAELVGARLGRPEVVVSSFNLMTVDAVRAVDPAIATGWLTLDAFDQIQAAETAAERGHTALHPHVDGLTAEAVLVAHRLGLAVTTWTVDDPQRLREVVADGVDALITNVPAVAVATLR